MKTKFLLFALLCASQCHSMQQVPGYDVIGQFRGFPATKDTTLVPLKLNQLLILLPFGNHAVNTIQQGWRNLITQTLIEELNYTEQEAEGKYLSIETFVNEKIESSRFASADEFEALGFPKNIAQGLQNEFEKFVVEIPEGAEPENPSR